MLKKLISKWRGTMIEDPQFGAMRSTYDRHDDLHYLYKSLDWKGFTPPPDLYLIVSQGESHPAQLQAFTFIQENLPAILENTNQYLRQEELITVEGDWSDLYQLEIILIPQDLQFPNFQWELNFQNLKDGFSMMELEMVARNPISHSFRA